MQPFYLSRSICEEQQLVLLGVYPLSPPKRFDFPDIIQFVFLILHQHSDYEP